MSSAAYDAFVSQLVAANVAEHAAHRMAREKFPDAAAEKAREVERRESVLEKDEQREVRKLLVAFGFRVYWLSQARKSGQTAGIPDLWFAHRELPIAGWFETKRSAGGRVSDAQQQFADECRRAGVRHIIGDRYAARTFLINLGLAYVDAGGALEPIRRAAGSPASVKQA